MSAVCRAASSNGPIRGKDASRAAISQRKGGGRIERVHEMSDTSDCLLYIIAFIIQNIHIVLLVIKQYLSCTACKLHLPVLAKACARRAVAVLMSSGLSGAGRLDKTA